MFDEADESNVVTVPRSRERTPREQEYDARVAACVLKPAGHVQQPMPEGITGNRLYTVTTLAASDRYGGTRTPVICDSFEVAKELVEENAGDIFEMSYRLAVIEAVLPNRLYNIGLDERYWYKWVGDYETGSYQAIDVPPGYENVMGFGIG